MDPVLQRRILGTAGVIMVIALGFLGMKLRYAPPAGSYEVEAQLGRAGSGLRPGSDVKARGVRIGEVASLSYDEGLATATLQIEGEHPIPAPQFLELAVTAKTLLGEKQVELFFPDERFGQEPLLAAGDQIEATRQPTELQEALDELADFTAAIDGQKLGAIVDTLGQQQGEGERIARNIQVSQELAAFGGRTAEQSLANLRRLADVAEALEPAAADFNRMNDNLPAATSLIVERQAEVRRNLEAVSTFATTFNEFLSTEESSISRLMRTGDPIGAVLERRAPYIAEVVDGLHLYAKGLGKHGGDLNDGSEFAPFRILLGGSHVDPVTILCAESSEVPVPFECPEEGGP
jgi:phospholipid/cholesterol/gamma-HCH transport system substrate-binding protein